MDPLEIVVTPEEIAEEQKHSAPPKEDEIRQKFVTDLELDPEDEKDKARLDKLVQKEMVDRKRLSDTIGAKVGYRTKLQNGGKKNEVLPKKEDKDLSSEDVLVLVGAQITHPDDIKKIKEAAKLLGTDVAGALKNDLVKGQIKQAQEYRASADAGNDGGGRGGSKKKSGAELIEEANKGNLPEPGSPEAEELFWAKRGGRKE